jgi:hypothetical protein
MRIKKREIITEWRPFTPVYSWTTNLTGNGMWRRVGDSIDIQLFGKASGAPDNSALTFTLPMGLRIAWAKWGPTTARHSYGRLTTNDAGNIWHGVIVDDLTSDTTLKFFMTDATGGLAVSTLTAISGNTIPFTWGADDTFYASLKSIPVMGW